MGVRGFRWIIYEIILMGNGGIYPQRLVSYNGATLRMDGL